MKKGTAVLKNHDPGRFGRRWLVVVLVVMLIGVTQAQQDHIQPFKGNPFYWQYEGKPVLLLGGSKDDNLFQIEGLKKHLDRLASVGGNYVRNTMSHRGKGEAFPYERTADGLFDLTRWNEKYWDRFQQLLALARERDIVVQIEIWDPWDLHTDSEPQGGWALHPFNPQNNVNYTAEGTGLPTEIDQRPGSDPSGHRFYLSVPNLDDIPQVLRYQELFVDKVLGIALEYPNVLYCIHNEIGEPMEWGEYWARRVRKRANETGVEVHITDMRRTNDINDKDHRHIHDRPDLYSFIEVSQNNGGHNPDFWRDAEAWHWDRLIELRTYLEANNLARPINNNKIYGHESEDSWGGADQGVQKFWRNLFTGCASVRFHRPPSGIGLSELAQAHIHSARMWSETFDVFRSEPDAHHELLGEREANEAYLMQVPGEQYTVYFPEGGEVTLDLSDAQGTFTLRWLDANESAWQDGGTTKGGQVVELKAPGEGHHVAVLTR